MIFYTNRFIPKKFAGYTIGPFILIRPAFKTDKALHEHEKVHVRQFWRYLGLNGLLYKFSKRFRLKFEVEAHQVEYRTDPIRIDKLADNLVKNYGLTLSVERAKKLIRGEA